MNDSRNVTINRLPSGVPKLDDILGGGWPEYSFNLIVGEPGSGKTTLAHQFMFANATAERPALYFTVLGEPTLKMLRYQQQFTFFDMSKVNNVVHCESERRSAHRHSKVLLDEIPAAYKDIDEVMEHARDLVEVKYVLKQFVNVKGD